MLLDDETFVLKLVNGALHNALVVILPVGGWVVLLVGGICISSSSTTAPSPSSPLAARFSSSWFYKVVLLGGIHIGPVFLLGSLSLLGITLHTAHISNVLNLHKCTHQQFISVPESWDTVFGDVCCALQCIWKTLRCSAQHNWIGRVHPLVCGKMKRLVEMCSG